MYNGIENAVYVYGNKRSKSSNSPKIKNKMIYTKVLKMQCIYLVRNFQKKQKRARILNTMI